MSLTIENVRKMPPRNAVMPIPKTGRANGPIEIEVETNILIVPLNKDIPNPKIELITARKELSTREIIYPKAASVRWTNELAISPGQLSGLKAPP